MSSINFVKYYFYKGTMPTDQSKLKNLIAIAYQTARDKRLYPKAILIRYLLHHLSALRRYKQKVSRLTIKSSKLLEAVFMTRLRRTGHGLRTPKERM